MKHLYQAKIINPSGGFEFRTLYAQNIFSATREFEEDVGPCYRVIMVELLL